MKLGMPLPYAATSVEDLDRLGDYEDAGIDLFLFPEVYGFDAVSHLAYASARTRRARLATGVVNIYSRTPALLAMTAAGLDHVSEGRLMLGVGASGPQVIEGLHGVPFDAPVGRTREIVDICRTLWRGEVLQHQGRHYEAPLSPESGGSGLGKPLKLLTPQARPRIPMMLAAIGPRNVRLAAEMFEAWIPPFFSPAHAAETWGQPLADGLARRSDALGPLEVVTSTTLCLTDDTNLQEFARQQVRERLALYIGGMGARDRNFYADLVCRYGYSREARRVQDLYLSGDKAGAAAAVPAELAEQTSLVGGAERLRDGLAAFEEAGVTTLAVTPVAPDHTSRVTMVRAVEGLLR